MHAPIFSINHACTRWVLVSVIALLFSDFLYYDSQAERYFYFARLRHKHAFVTHSSLLGNCNSAGVCECDPGWTSATCSVLHLAPAPTRERQARMTNMSSWGGNAIRDASTGFYHLFFSEMRTGGLHSYSYVPCLDISII